MRDSSASDMDAFQGIQWHNIQELLRIVLQSELSSSQSIARRYREQATSFGKTLVACPRENVPVRDRGYPIE